MTLDEIVGKKFWFQGQEHVVTQVRKIQDDSKFKHLVYSDTLYPVSYDIVFEEHIVDTGV